MDELLAGLAPQALLFVLIATRLGAMIATAPVFSSRTIPVRVKSGLVVLLAFLSLPLVEAQGGVPPTHALSVILLVGKEAIIGLAFGLMAQFVFAGIQTAGSFIDMNAGFAIARAIDPTSGINLSVLGRWYNLVAISAFIAIGGHQWLVAGVVQSFELAPPLEMPQMSAIVEGVLSSGDDILLIALQVGGPIMAALLVTDVVLGLLSRSVPQMNVFLVGLPLKIVVALSATAILLPAFLAFMNGLTSDLLFDLNEMLRAAGGG